jgi:hypothetical protein
LEAQMTLVLLWVLAADNAPPAMLKDRPICAWGKGSGINAISSAQWTGQRFAVAWGERSPVVLPPAAPEPRKGPPLPDTPAAPPAPTPPPVIYEVKVGQLEAQGERTGGSKVDVTPVDGFDSNAGMLAFSGGELGLLFGDRHGGPDSIYFRRLDKTGRPLDEPKMLSRAWPPQWPAALAWNGSTEEWGALWTGARAQASKHGPGSVTHHLFLSRFRSAAAPSEPVQLDEAESTLVERGAGLWPRGPCFVTAWADYPSMVVTFAEVCADGVHRLALSARGRRPSGVTLAPTARGFAIAWVDAAGAAALETDLYVALAENVAGEGWKTTWQKSFPAPTWASEATAAFDGSLTWVAWAEQKGYPPTTQDVLVMSIGPDGATSAPRAVPQHFAAPVFLTWAQGPKSHGVIVSTPNELECLASFVPVR